jgi:hypothetical protein
VVRLLSCTFAPYVHRAGAKQHSWAARVRRLTCFPSAQAAKTHVSCIENKEAQPPFDVRWAGHKKQKTKKKKKKKEQGSRAASERRAPPVTAEKASDCWLSGGCRFVAYCRLSRPMTHEKSRPYSS